jgi:imidazolonepropionase-like amidohydrolase
MANPTPAAATGTPGATGTPASNPSGGTSPGSILFRNVRVFDGAGVASGVDSVVVENGHITAVGAGLAAPTGAQIVDGTGDTLLPGLIDAHTHHFPGSEKEALAFGVTTELDMMADPKEIAQVKADEAAGKEPDGADVLSAGWAATCPGGHGTEYGMTVPTLSKPEEAQAFVDARLAEGSDYIKVIDEHGYGVGWKIPGLSLDTITAVIKATHARGKLAVVHVGSAREAKDAVDAGADGLAHLFADAPPDPGFVADAAAHHLFVIPTLTVLESVCGTPSGVELTKDPALTPYLSLVAQGNLVSAFPPISAHCDLSIAQGTAKALLAAGVPILAGSDAPNPGTAHGASVHRELVLLVEGGLTPTQALTAATAAPATAFKLADRGRIAVGLRADLVLVKGDPTADIHATRAIVGIWKAGVAYDRAAWSAHIQATVKADADGEAKGLISDFEAGSDDTGFGLGWMPNTDIVVGGTSTVDLTVVDGGAPGSDKHSLAVKGTVARSKMGMGFASAAFDPAWGAPFAVGRDLSDKRSLELQAKGDGGTYQACIYTRAAAFMPECQPFVAGPAWKSYTLSYKVLDAKATDVTAITFGALLLPGGKDAGGPFSFVLDDVRLGTKSP